MAPAKPGSPTTSRPTRSMSPARWRATRASGASTRPARAACAARERSRRWPVHAPAVRPGPHIDRALLAALPDRLCQHMFDRTGGLHATGPFTAGGELVIVREDVGRHNSMDRVIGRALLDGLLPLSTSILLRERPAVVRARAQGCGRRRAELTGDRARRRSRHDTRRIREAWQDQHLHGANGVRP